MTESKFAEVSSVNAGPLAAAGATGRLMLSLAVGRLEGIGGGYNN
jgi:hypothetical protein